MNVVEQIKQYLVENKISQKEFAVKIETSYHYFNQVLRLKQCNTLMSDKIIKHTGVDKDEFYNEFKVTNHIIRKERLRIEAMREKDKIMLGLINRFDLRGNDAYDMQYEFASKSIKIGNIINAVIYIGRKLGNSMEKGMSRKHVSGEVIFKNTYFTSIRTLKGTIETLQHADLLCGLAKIQEESI